MSKLTLKSDFKVSVNFEVDLTMPTLSKTMQGSYRKCSDLGFPAPADTAGYEQPHPVAVLVVGPVDEHRPSYAHGLVCEPRTSALEETAGTGMPHFCALIGSSRLILVGSAPATARWPRIPAECRPAAVSGHPARIPSLTAARGYANFERRKDASGCQLPVPA